MAQVELEGKAADRVSFLLNNVTAQTAASHASELAAKLQARHHRWFAARLVRQKAAHEPNYHATYVELLIKIDSRALYKASLETSYEARASLLAHVFTAHPCAQGMLQHALPLLASC